ncbi:hypothetical protein [Novosphingobium clariflavum]|uniref:Uncharacterized protein n=1 Tax=Novosphingobium clariflavum TaxID=2029884 RepID=A0ABV6S6R4_9SPHN|nr:hypothetical protein [Novosphingobium clariflavum]
MRSQSDAQASAEVLEFPRAGFLINSDHCGAPSEDRLSMCLRQKGHDGDHETAPWEGFRLRSPWGDGMTIPFRGFVGS